MTRRQIIGWLQKKGFAWLLVAAALFVVVTTALTLLDTYGQPRTTLRLGDGVFSTRLALTEAERKRGLSGTSTLEQTHALLLVFDNDDEWPIWMKDMHYPIDVIWLDSAKAVVHIEENVSPDTYPRSFTPEQPARYIVEVPAGTVEKRGIMLNMIASFDINEGVK
jgi:uncharacterized membrane protein (UPF0127 family)